MNKTGSADRIMNRIDKAFNIARKSKRKETEITVRHDTYAMLLAALVLDPNGIPVLTFNDPEGNTVEVNGPKMNPRVLARIFTEVADEIDAGAKL